MEATQLNPERTEKILSKYNIPYCRTVFAKNKEEAVRASKSLGFPVVVKIVAPSIIHKTEAGGVKVNLKNEEEVINAVNEMRQKAKDFEGVLIQRMLTGYEAIIGGKKDPQFGPVVLFGLGGIFVEVFKDVSLRIAPIDEKESLKMIGETKAYNILKGARGKAPANLEKLSSLISLVSKLINSEKDIKELDFNPVFVNDKEAVVVDARLIV